MNADEPVIRANWTRMLVDHYERQLAGPERARVLTAIDPVVRARLDAAGPLEWLPASVHLHMLRAGFSVLRAEGSRALWNSLTRMSFDRPVFRMMVQGAMAMFRNDTVRILEFIPQGWALVARSCGQFRVIRVSERVADVQWTDVPESFLADDSFIAAWTGSLLAVLAHAGREGKTGSARSEQARNVVSFRCTW